MRRESIREIHASPLLLAVVATGGGSDAIASLLKVPGASRTLLEAVIPYGFEALARYLGNKPDQACSEATARALAMQALLRALSLAPGPADREVAGVACTASLASDRAKRGEHRCHIAVHTTTRCTALSLVLQRGARSRDEEEALTSDLLLGEIAAVAGVESGPAPQLLAGESPQRRNAAARTGWRELLLGEIQMVYLPHGEAAPPGVLLSGAFNPLHEGHLGMAEVAAGITGSRSALELSIVNADKAPLDYLEIADRVDRIAPSADLYLTRAPTFADKAALFPGVTFLVGTDTLQRIAEPRFYGNDERKRDEAIVRIRDAGCRFLVFGRAIGERYTTFEELALPPALREISEGVAESAFRLDISSTEIRRRNR